MHYTTQSLDALYHTDTCVNRSRFRLGSRYQYLHYDGPSSQRWDMPESIDEWKQSPPRTPPHGPMGEQAKFSVETPLSALPWSFFSNMWYAKSAGEFKHCERSSWRHLCYRSAYNDKFYGSDCGLGLLSRICRSPIIVILCVWWSASYLIRIRVMAV